MVLRQGSPGLAAQISQRSVMSGMGHRLVFATNQLVAHFNHAVAVAHRAGIHRFAMSRLDLFPVCFLSSHPVGVSFSGVGTETATRRRWVVDVRLTLAWGFGRAY